MGFLKKFTKQEISWMMYDWANSAHSVIVVTILPIFFDTVAGYTADSVSSMSTWGFATSLAMAIVALSAPFLGVFGDIRGMRKKLFTAFMLIGVVSVAGLSFTPWRNTPSVVQNFIFRQTFTPEMHRSWLATKVATGQVVQYIILDNADGKPVGSVYYRDIDNHNRSAEYGIFIGEESARGKGLGTEAARLFTQFGVDTLHLHRISLRVLAENAAARRSYEKAGFVQEGVFRDMELLDGAYRDVVFMAKLAEN